MNGIVKGKEQVLLSTEFILFSCYPLTPPSYSVFRVKNILKGVYVIVLFAGIAGGGGGGHATASEKEDSAPGTWQWGWLWAQSRELEYHL